MRKNEHLRTPDDQSNPGHGGTTSDSTEAVFTSEESTRADLKKAARPPTETPRDTKTGGQQISGPGPNDLTRGLP